MRWGLYREDEGLYALMHEEDDDGINFKDITHYNISINESNCGSDSSH